jgi:hypothetical protein
MRLSLLAALALAACEAPPPVPEAGEKPYGAHEDSAAAPDGDDTADVVEPEDTAPTWDPAEDTDGDGLSDGDEGRADTDAGSRDTDGDGTPDYRDEDSDGDGIPDVVEVAPRDDDGQPADTDGDGAPDHLDTDSDGDGILDAAEAGLAPETPLDSDGDGTPDYRDRDSDDDGLLDSVEGVRSDGTQPDTDGDGAPDHLDTDSDGDGLLDEVERMEDWDGDGVLNYVDVRNDGLVPPLLFTAISTAFNSPIGIDYHEATGTVVVSVNYPSGAPYAFERIQTDGTHVAFSSVSGLTNEVKIATARTGAAGFSPGELFVGNGNDGEIVRISADGLTVDNPWVSLPGDGNGLPRGSLYVDRTGVWGNELLVATTAGELWRIDSAGTPTLIADVGVHLEGLVTVPDSPDRFGPLAGRAIAGAENEGLLHAFAPDGSHATFSLGVNIEDIEVVVPNENFFGVNYGTSRVIGVSASELLPMAGDILLTQESHSGVGLYRLNHDGADLVVEELRAASGSATLGQWEHVTTANAGIQEVPL